MSRVRSVQIIMFLIWSFYYLIADTPEQEAFMLTLLPMPVSYGFSLNDPHPYIYIPLGPLATDFMLWYIGMVSRPIFSLLYLAALLGMYAIYYLAEYLLNYGMLNRRSASEWITYYNKTIHCPKAHIYGFRDFDFSIFDKFKSKGGHSHEESASKRSLATKAIEQMIHSAGMEPYNIQMSRYDQSRGIKGTRTHYWARDMSIDARYDSFKKKHCPIIIDVDYYLDMEEMLLEYQAPMYLYTLNPTAAARATNEYSYCFNKDNEVEYKVSGGGVYTHKLWNYNTDHITVRSYHYPEFFGKAFPKQTIVYQIDRHTVTLDRDIVLLTPVVRLGSLGSFMAKDIKYDRLKRMRVSNGEFNRMEIRRQLTHHVSIAYCEPGQYTAATIPVAADNYFRNLSKVQSTPLAIFNVQQYLKTSPENLCDSLQESAILVGYYTSQLRLSLSETAVAKVLPKAVLHTLYPRMAPITLTVYPVEYAVKKYHFDPGPTEAEPMLTPFMAPFVNDGYVPTKTKGNEERAVEGRVKEVRPPVLPISSLLDNIMDEFVTHLFPTPHILAPVTPDEVLEHQHRPTQRNIIFRALFSPIYHMKRKITTFFLKAESYAKPADPRIICVMDPTTKLESSTYLYPIADFLKQQPWYAFGKSPEEIATRVSEICQHSDFVSTSDFSRMDGHISNVCRELDKRIVLRAYKLEYHGSIIEMLSSLQDLKAVGAYGTKFATLFNQCSGDLFTAGANGWRNLFAHYRAARSKKINGRYLTPKEAWEYVMKFVLVGGDDGIAGMMEEKELSQACQSIGQVLEYDSVRRGELGVNFLSRYYTTQVWYGDINSCCDIKRQLIKFHLSLKLDKSVSPEQKLYEKIKSFSMTDSNTPIIGPFVKKGLELGKKIKSTVATAQLASYLSTQGPVPNQYHADFHQLMYNQLPSTTTSEKHFLYWLEGVNNFSDLLNPPTLQEEAPPQQHPTQPVVINGVIYPPKQEKHRPPEKPKIDLPPPPQVQPFVTKEPPPTIQLIAKQPQNIAGDVKKRVNTPPPTKQHIAIQQPLKVGESKKKSKEKSATQ